MQIMYPAIFDQLLAFVEFSCKPPQYGQLETKHIANAKYNQVRCFNYSYFEFTNSQIWLALHGLCKYCLCCEFK